MAALPFHARPGAARRGRRGPGLAPGSRHHGPILTEAELEDCIRRERWIDATGARIAGLEAQLDAEARELERIGADIDARRTRLDTRSQRAVDAYNAEVQRHRQRTQAHNMAVAEYNQQVAALNGQVAQYNAACANRAYFESDHARVIARLGG